MNRILNTLIISAVSVFAFSCQEVSEIDATANESIVLDISSGITKAEDTDVESFVSHLDVLIFDVDGNGPGSKVYSGRYNVNNASSVTLNARRSSFSAGSRYYVYLIANSTLPETDFADVTTYNDLVDKKQEDVNLHLTGLTVDGAPRYFLMDAVAEDSDGASPVVLNNGVFSDNTVLSALLVRAAAKVVVNIKASERVEFRNFTMDDASEGGLYYLRNMPYDAYLLAESREDERIRTAKVRNTAKTNNAYFTWNPAADSRNVSLTTYVYPNNWADNSIIEREASIVVNLPMTITTDGNATDYKNSWYKIPMTDEKMFKRNNYYEVNINLNRPGAATESVPVDVEDIYYSVIEWTGQDIFVGGDDRPRYLSVNKESMSMHNIAVDATTLEFASSSPVTITVKDIYYYNKFGQKTTVSPVITGTTDGGIAGNITVNSPVPTNNAIRYFTLVITNEEGITREVQVTQYPLEYITNTQAYYSYRSDFYTHDNSPDSPTRYDYRGDGYVSATWSDRTNTWSYSTNNGSGSGFFFRSKVATLSNNASYAGKSDLHYYKWGTSSTAKFAQKNTEYKSASDDDDPGNARMYHVQITASSGEYVVGIPARDPVTDYTLSDSDNARLVSPSFMIASQLGATSSTTSTSDTYITRAKSHCSQYVETYFDDLDNDGVWDEGETIHHLDDWRLPTEEEIKIIVKFQTSSEVMDIVLAGANYFCASPTGYVATGVESGNGIYTRCIRDVY
jgi:hypothetical protein